MDIEKLAGLMAAVAALVKVALSVAEHVGDRRKEKRASRGKHAR